MRCTPTRQATIDLYNASYVAHHLARRPSASLLALSAEPGTAEPTGAFIGRYVAAQRAVLRDGQIP